MPDVMVQFKGLKVIDFEECYKYVVVAEIEGISVRYLHYNRFTTYKKAAGRPRDLPDIEELEKNAECCRQR